MFVLPSSITMASVFCGFSSVVMSINAAGATPERFFLWAAGLLVLAGIFDGLDGRVARATNTATDFGETTGDGASATFAAPQDDLQTVDVSVRDAWPLFTDVPVTR